MSDLPANRYIVSEFYRSYRLDRYIQAMIPKLSRAKIQEAIRTRVSVSWHPQPRPSLVVVPGGEVAIHFPEIVEPPVPSLPKIIYEDESILVADKPAGMLVHPTHSCRMHSLIHLMRAERPGLPLSLAHRLDRDTSGLILLTKTVEASRALAGMFERREVAKTYLAVAAGSISPAEGRIDADLGVTQHLQVIFKRSANGKQAQKAVTEYRVLATGGDVCLVLLSPRTGRRHQLRAHLASIGHPIVGDKLYTLSDREYLKHLRGLAGGGSRAPLTEATNPGNLAAAAILGSGPRSGRSDNGALVPAGSAPPAAVPTVPAIGSTAPAAPHAGRQLLHAYRLSFVHPANGVPVAFESPIPDDMKAFLASSGITPPE
jgi:23S rRNA pseudouridine1911/1915/1917 synthase